MSRRRCCCTPQGEAYCFCFEVDATHGQFCTLQNDIVNCSFTAVGCDDPVPSWYVVNNYRSSIGPLGPQQFVVASEPPTPQPCDCRTNWCKSVYTWTNPDNSFKRQLCFTLGCGPGAIPQSSSTGDISVVRFDAPNCPGGAYCGCCGTQTDIVRITYEAEIPAATVNGECGTVTYTYAGGAGGFGGGAWFTRFTAYYCWVWGGSQNPTPCKLTLTRIDMTTPNAPQSSNGDVCGATEFGGPCETQYDTCSVPASSWCAPFTGDGAIVYGLAGSPPMTLDCRSCECP